jgi:hypothetical protein
MTPPGECLLRMNSNEAGLFRRASCGPHRAAAGHLNFLPLSKRIEAKAVPLSISDMICVFSQNENNELATGYYLVAETLCICLLK